MIVPLNELFKDNLTISYDTNARYAPEQIDSIAWVQSCFIQHISDSIFLTGFTNRLIDELAASGFDVYVDGGADVFLSLPDPKWIVQIAQLQLNEDHKINYFQKYSVSDGKEYYEAFRINQVNLESWFEVSRANAGNKQVLYLEGYIQDDFHLGIDFDLMDGDIGFLGERDSIEVKDVYSMAEQSGKKHAELLFDYFMNDYIRENLHGITSTQYFHYNRFTDKLKKGAKERFDIVN